MKTAVNDFANEPFFDPDNARGYWVRFGTLLGIAAVIATIGLYRNSGAVVIAAMLIAPLMTPILGIAKALVLGWTPRMLYLLVIVLLAGAATIGLSFAVMALAEAPQGMLVPSEVQGRTDPGLEELMIALAAGIAGAYVEMRRQEASLPPGVAIGVSLVPPLAAAGISSLLRPHRRRLGRHAPVSGKNLKTILRQTLGPNTDIQFQLQFGYAGILDLKTGEQIGVTVPVEPVSDRAPEASD